MRGAHAARAALLIIGCCFTQMAASGQDVAHAAGSFAPPAPLLAELGGARMPGGLVALCQRDPSFCRPAPVATSFLDDSVPQLQLLASVNDRVNHSIASTTDRALYGKDEYWTIPRTAGDCEDYVLLKREVLMHLGLPEASLLITVVHDENGEGHAVLTVPTDGGDLVLDNRRDEILRWWETGYSFIKRQSEYDPLNWVSLGEDKLQATEIASGPGLP
jgi:predicted transglutaminase-like cysteine proteinase